MAEKAIYVVWPKFKAGHIDQLKIVAAAEAFLNGKSDRTDRDIRKLFVNKVQAGSITRDQSTITVKIKTLVLSGE